LQKFFSATSFDPLIFLIWNKLKHTDLTVSAKLCS